MRAIYELMKQVNSWCKTTKAQLEKSPDDEYLRGRRDAFKAVAEAFYELTKNDY